MTTPNPPPAPDDGDSNFPSDPDTEPYDDESDDDESDDGRVTSIAKLIPGYEAKLKSATTPHLDGKDIFDALRKAPTCNDVIKYVYGQLEESRWRPAVSESQLHRLMPMVSKKVVVVAAGFLRTRERRVLLMVCRTRGVPDDAPSCVPPARPIGADLMLETWLLSRGMLLDSFTKATYTLEITRILVAMAAVDWNPFMHAGRKMWIAMTFVLVELGSPGIANAARLTTPPDYYDYAMWIPHLQRTLTSMLKDVPGYRPDVSVLASICGGSQYYDAL